MANLSKIKDLAKERNTTITEIAKEIGLSQQAVLKIIRENSTKIETLEKISHILKVSPSVFFDDVVYNCGDNSTVGINNNSDTVIKSFIDEMKEQRISFENEKKRLLDIIEQLIQTK